MGIGSIYNQISGLGKTGADIMKKAGREYKAAFNQADSATQSVAVTGLAGMGAVAGSTALNMKNPLNLRR